MLLVAGLKLLNKITTYVDNNKTANRIVKKIDRLSYIMHKNFGHLFNQLEIQTQCYIIIQKLQVRRDYLTDCRKVKYPINQLKYDLTSAMNELSFLLVRIEMQ